MRQAIPYAMGGAMGLMMLGMVHMTVTGQSELGVWAAIGFVLAHVAAVLVIVVVPLAAARHIPRLARYIEQMHRPSWAHLRQMLIGAGLAVALTHVTLHGLF